MKYLLIGWRQKLHRGHDVKIIADIRRIKSFNMKGFSFFDSWKIGHEIQKMLNATGVGRCDSVEIQHES